MKIRVLGCHGSRLPGFYTSSLLIDGRVLLDAGTVTASLSIEEQAAIDHILLTHAHLDHIVDLAFLADNVFTLRREPLRIWGPEPVLHMVHRYLFNNDVWPDFSRILAGDFPLVEFCPLPVDGFGEVAGIPLQWCRTNHVVFTAGYLLHGGTKSVLYSGDTTTTVDLWAMARNCPGLALAFVETSFPNRLGKLAEASGHLTPELLASELHKLARPQLPVKVFHMKPQFLEEIHSELLALDSPRLQMLHGGEEFVI